MANIILADGGSRIASLDRMLTEALAKYDDVNVPCAEDISYVRYEGSLKLAMDVKPELWDEPAW